MQLPNFTSYCDRTTKGNALVFTLGAVDVYFSYTTPVAFRSPKVNAGRVVVRENEWGPTTGKHLRAIDGLTSKEAKGKRVNGEDFQRMLGEALAEPDAEPGAEPDAKPDPLADLGREAVRIMGERHLTVLDIAEDTRSALGVGITRDGFRELVEFALRAGIMETPERRS